MKTFTRWSELEARASQRPTRVARRVLLVARWPVGGIRTHLAYNYPALTAAGFPCSLVVPDGAYVAPMRAALPGAEVIAAVPGEPLWRTVRREVASGRYRLVHAHGLGAAAHSVFGCLRQEAPLIVTLHEPLRPAQFAGLTGAGRRWLLGRALSRARTIVTVSEDSRANLLRFFPNLRKYSDRIRTVPNGIDIAPYRSRAPSGGLREELGLDGETPLVGLLGRFMPEKGLPLLLDAIQLLRRSPACPAFHVAAFGAGDYRAAYAARIAREGLGHYLTLRDPVPCVAPLLPQFDLVVVPSLWEASSLVSMEAMVAGVPVLGSNCPGLREVLRDTPSRLFQAGNAAALADALRQAITSPWRDAARRFAPQAQRRFDNRASAQQLVQFYHRLVGSERA